MPTESEKPKINVLLVEDDDAHAEIVRRGFANGADDMKLSVATTLDEARIAINRKLPDVIFADWKLPDGKGLDLLPSDPASVSCPIIVLTSHGSEKLAVETLKSGALDYLVKSVETMLDIPHLARRALQEWDNILKRKESENLVCIQRDLVGALSAVSDLSEALNICLEAIQSVSGCERAGLYLLDESTDEMTLAAHHGFSKEFIAVASRFDSSANEMRIINAGQPVYGRISDVRSSIFDALRDKEDVFFAMIPIRFEGRSIGCLVSTSCPGRLPSSLVRHILEAIVAQIGGAFIRLQTEQKLSRLEKMYETIVESASDGILVAQNGIIRFANQRALEWCGYDKSEVLGRSFLSFVTPEDRERLEKNHQDRMRGKESPSHYSTTIIARDGGRIPIQVSAALFDWKGKHASLVILTDMTDRVRYEQLIIENERKFRLLTENQKDVVFLIGLDGTIEYCSPAIKAFGGYQPEDMIGKHYESFILEQSDYQQTRLDFMAIIKNLETKSGELLFKPATGLPFWIDVVGRPNIIDGDIVSIHCVTRDISEQKKAESQVRHHLDSERLLAAISTDFINIEPDKIDGGITDAISTIGGFSDVSQCGVYLFSDDNLTAELKYEWRNEELETWTDAPKSVPLATIEWLSDQIKNFENILIPDFSIVSMKDALNAVKVIAPNGCRALLAVPLILRGRALGFLDMVSIRDTRDWLFDDLAIIETLGNIIVQAIERQ